MAEGIARHFFGTAAQVASAGSTPRQLHPLAVEALREWNVNIDHHHSKSCAELPAEFLTRLDYLVTLCADEVCPAHVIKDGHVKRLHWPLPDPQGIDSFRQVREQILAHLKSDFPSFAMDTSDAMGKIGATVKPEVEKR
jgi:arsenate reductase